MNMPVTSDAELLARIEAFCARYSMKPTAFGRAALSDGNLISNLREGRSVTLKSAQRVLDFMATYRPESQQDSTPNKAKAA